MEYDHGGTKLEGWHAQDAEKTGRSPAVLLVHLWLGITDYEKKRAEMLAELGYNVLCADVYESRGTCFAYLSAAQTRETSSCSSKSWRNSPTSVRCASVSSGKLLGT